MNLMFTDKAWEEYVLWQATDKKIVKKINALIKDIKRNGLTTGQGKPERLMYGLQGLYSRRITQEHRLIYAQDEHDNLLIIKCKGHYE